MSDYLTFSVVVPTYNRAAFIERTLQSVLAQTYPHYEIIVVDDCSTDNTEELLRPLINSGKIRFIRHDQNRERGYSRNTGMEAATGDFLTLLDSDDLMYPNNLEDAAKYAQANPKSKFFYNLHELIDLAGNVVYRTKHPTQKDQIKAIACGNFMSCIGEFMHREVYGQYRFDTDRVMSGTEDWDFWLRVLAKYRAGKIEKVNSGLTHHHGRSVNNLDIASLQTSLERIVRKIYDDPQLAAVYRPYFKQMEANYLIYLAIQANSGMIYETALNYLRQAAAKDLSVVATRRFLRALQIALFKMNGVGAGQAEKAN